MLVVRLVLLVLHVASAAVIFGAPLGQPRVLRTALTSKSEEAFRLAAREAVRRGLLAQGASATTLVTGIILILISGGFAAVPSSFHVALALMLGAIGFGAGYLRPIGQKLVSASGASPLDKSALAALITKLASGSGLLQAVWLVILVLMFYRF
jgi:hypothetical protein